MIVRFKMWLIVKLWESLSVPDQWHEWSKIKPVTVGERFNYTKSNDGKPE